MKNSSGLRQRLKGHLPPWIWPLFRWLDARLTAVFYCYRWALRALSYPALPLTMPPGLLPRSALHLDCPLLSGARATTDIATTLIGHNIAIAQGRHSIYIGSRADIDRLFPELCRQYPFPVGVKIVKSQELSGDGSPYYTSRQIAPASTWFSMRAVGSVREKMVVSNLLSTHGVAPRVYDLLAINVADRLYYGLLVQPLEGEVVHGEKAMGFMRRFRDAMTVEGVEAISVREHKDLRFPDYNDNIVDSSEGPKYVDIQNFTLARRSDSYRQALAWGKQQQAASGPSNTSGYSVMTRSGENIKATESVFPLVFLLDFRPYVFALLEQVQGLVRIVMPEPNGFDKLTKNLYLHGFGNFDFIAMDEILGKFGHHDCLVAASDMVVVDDHFPQQRELLRRIKQALSENATPAGSPM